MLKFYKIINFWCFRQIFNSNLFANHFLNLKEQKNIVNTESHQKISLNVVVFAEIYFE
jgi:hypothetical protein